MKTKHRLSSIIMHCRQGVTGSRKPPTHAGHHADCPCPRTRPSTFDTVGFVLPLGVGIELVGLELQ
jgi:hypothetical protein